MNNKNLKNHTITQSQARRYGLKAGQVVQVILYNEDEKKGRPWRKNMAKTVYFNGKKVAGNFDLKD